MSPSHRKKRTTKALPPYLYENKGYYVYRHPITRKEFGMGKDRNAAKAAAIKLNQKFLPGEDLVAHVMGDKEKTIRSACEAFIRERIEGNPKLAESSQKEKTYRVNRISQQMGKHLLKSLTTVDVAKWLESFSGDSYKQHRSVLSQVIDFAQTKGWIDKNVVTPTLSHDIHYVKQRKRLTLEQYLEIRKLAEPWFRVAMDLALLTCQGRTEIANMQYSQIEGDVLYVVRQKTYKKTDTAYIAIHITPALRKVIEFSQTLEPRSEYMVRRRPQAIKKETRQGQWQVKAPYISREFQKLRDKVKSIAKLDEKARPTFHEIRSLGGHLLEKSGADTRSVQALMGHSDAEMTEHYLSGHAQKWTPAIASDFEIQLPD